MFDDFLEYVRTDVTWRATLVVVVFAVGVATIIVGCIFLAMSLFVQR